MCLSCLNVEPNNNVDSGKQCSRVVKLEVGFIKLDWQWLIEQHSTNSMNAYNIVGIQVPEKI